MTITRSSCSDTAGTGDHRRAGMAAALAAAESSA